MNSYTEDASIEQPAIALLRSLGWETSDCFDETLGNGGMLERETPRQVLLFSRFQASLTKLNPDLPIAAVEQRSRNSAAITH
jgi:type I restriction enzyme R subunit